MDRVKCYPHILKALGGVEGLLWGKGNIKLLKKGENLAKGCGTTGERRGLGNKEVVQDMDNGGDVEVIFD